MCWILYSTDIIIVLLLRLAVYYCFAMYTAFFIMRISEVRTISEKYKKIGMELIEKHPALEVLNRFIKDKAIKLIFLKSTKEKKSTLGTVHADCEKIADSKRWAIDADFVITVYEPNVKTFSEAQLKILLLHELMHIGIELTKEGDLKKYLVPHSVQDFRYIHEKYGLDWSSPFQQLEFDFD